MRWIAKFYLSRRFKSRALYTLDLNSSGVDIEFEKNKKENPLAGGYFTKLLIVLVLGT
jgi:hypothetical protein